MPSMVTFPVGGGLGVRNLGRDFIQSQTAGDVWVSVELHSLCLCLIGTPVILKNIKFK